MHVAAQNFIERMGLHLEAEGLPRSAGRIFGFLLLTDCACSLDELADTLQISKASISTNARLLEQSGVLERTCEPGDRRDFYRLRRDAWERMLLVGRRRWEGMRRLLAEAQLAIPPEMATGHERLGEAERFHALLIDELDTLIDRWRASRETADLEDLTAVGGGNGMAAD
jgi:DNA-binding transcriptional regulator GbsR (MarR family)